MYLQTPVINALSDDNPGKSSRAMLESAAWQEGEDFGVNQTGGAPELLGKL